MNVENKAKVLAQYIRTLSDLCFENPEIPYNHMGATITDAMLQAGLNYKTVVEPRVKNLRDKHPEAKTTSGFLKLLKQVNINVLIGWKDPEKPKRILEVIDLFVKEGIETEKQLQKWLRNKNNIAKLGDVRGVGNKTIDYFKLLSGISTIAVDRHLVKFLDQAGIQVESYLEAKKIINKCAEQLKIDKSLLDHSIWKYMSTKKRQSK